MRSLRALVTTLFALAATQCSADKISDAIKTTATIDEPKGGLALLVIDQQVDFHPGGSLAIPTANKDATKIASFIGNHTQQLSQIVLTLDSHERSHIANGLFWVNKTGAHPDPYTVISSKDVISGVWTPRNPKLKEYGIVYTQALEKSGKFQLTIWPEHCIIGTPGHDLVPVVNDAVHEWVKQTGHDARYVMKGSNRFTEHYSALKAEFPLPWDPATSLNVALIDALKRASKVAVCGEALSHCVNFTVRDLVDNWPKNRMKDLIIMTDCTSPVVGFEDTGKKFLEDMKAKGLTIATTETFKMEGQTQSSS